MEEDEVIMEEDKTSAILAIFVGLVPLTILRGFVLTKFWMWFVEPFGVPSITIAHGIGLIYMMNYFGAKKPKDDENVWGQVFFTLTYTLMAWGMGAIVHLFM